MAWIAPEFADYVGGKDWDDMSFPEAMTAYLYADPNGNPANFDKPERWEKSGRVQFVKNTLNFLAIPAIGTSPGTSTQTNQVFGGQAAILFSRTATVKLTTPEDFDQPNVGKKVPLDYGSYITVQQQEESGIYQIEKEPLNTAFGAIPGRPYAMDKPEFWSPYIKKVFLLSNSYGEELDVNLTFLAAVLVTGR
ncbi:MAG: hypothetical protein HN804_10965 [Oceanospirillaceae bacterium]|jgi:hypothetical protein|nr:hypothetical protein [Oceanospirillaceae bacterium]